MTKPAPDKRHKDHAKTPARRAHFREQPRDDGHYAETIGADLRAARREKGMSLNQVADALRLKSADVKAIEESDFDALPGKTYAIGFVRAYAQLMGAASGAEVEEFVRRFKAEMSDAEELRFNSITRKDARRPVPWGQILTAAATLVIGFFVWRMADTAIGAGDDVINAYQPGLPRLAPEIVPELSKGQFTDVGLNAVALVGAEVGAPRPVDLPDGTSWGTENHDARIRLKALKDVWLRVEVEGRVMFERVLGAGDSYTAPGRGNARIVTRQAGDLEIYVDGGYIRRLGSEGDAFVGTTLDPDALLVGQ